MLQFNKDYKQFLAEYQAVLIRLANVEQRIASVEMENKDLRDKVLRKIQKKQEGAEDTPKIDMLPSFSAFGK